jgi:DNA-binding MarR family transcriptional regulator
MAVPAKANSTSGTLPLSRLDPSWCGDRRWATLLLVAEFGALTAAQVAGLTGRSRATVVRQLHELLRAGALRRVADQNDRAHQARYEITADGARHLERGLRQAGRPVPAGLGRRGGTDSGRDAVTDFVVRLAHHNSGAAGGGCLYRWRHAADTTAWLRSLGIEHVYPQGFGQWVEADTAIGFLLHADTRPDPRNSAAWSLAGYRDAPAGVPAELVLVVTTSPGHEHGLHQNLADLPLPVSVGVTTRDRLARSTSPAGPIWTVAETGTTRLHRLGEIPPPARPATGEP